ncbi:putative gamma-glutamylcyclotransferase CG2811 isoform X1 [Onthophagus taurus]|uniref:putative gamma-glutamylcyclotransferase CG2811 isoform X1 n=1 Tax=Onthophagus taurus TaxID=166361 RepID=UPI0039BE78BC
MSKLFKVFVYGTLKSGQPNHHWFSKDGGYYKFLFNATTLIKYPLIIASQYNIPFLLYSPGHGKNVKGEVYEVDETVLANLDILEDHPNWYERQLEDVYYDNDENKKDKVWVYFIKKFKSELLEKDTFECYDSKGAHGLKYVERYQRSAGDNYKNEIR